MKGIEIKDIRDNTCTFLHENNEYTLPLEYSPSHGYFISFQKRRITLNIKNDMYD